MFSEIRENKRLEKQKKIDRLEKSIGELEQAINIVKKNMEDLEENNKKNSPEYNKLINHKEILQKKLEGYKKDLEKLKL